MSFELKYLKYKNKYLNLKKNKSLNQIGGGAFGGLFNFFSAPSHANVITDQLEQFNETKKNSREIFAKYKESLEPRYYQEELEELSKDEERLERLFKNIKEELVTLHTREEAFNKISNEYNEKKGRFDSANTVVHNTLDLIKKNNAEYIKNWNTHRLILEDLKNIGGKYRKDVIDKYFKLW